MIDSFSFGVLAYNQQSFILETLDSILYQVSKYGQKIDCSLVIIDDASVDNTVDTINKWLSIHGCNFKNTSFICNRSNKGLVKNYQLLNRIINDEFFKIIAGDDLLSSKNVFDKYYDLGENELRTFLPAILKDGIITIDENRIIRHYYNLKNYNDQKAKKRFMRGNYFNTPSTIYHKELYFRSNCEALNSRFKLFEDNPTWYSMLKNSRETTIDFREDIIVLYRIHSNSISHSKKKNNPFIAELVKLWKVYRDDTRGLERLFWKVQIKVAFLPSVLQPLKWRSKIQEKARKLHSLFDVEYKEYKKKILSEVSMEQRYYNSIIKS